MKITAEKAAGLKTKNRKVRDEKSFLNSSGSRLLWGCGSHDNTAEGRLHSLLAETHEKAEQDNGNPSDIVEVRISYFRDGEVVSEACRGFIMDTHSPLINNVGIILGTTDKTLLSVPFVASFPTERKKSTFTCIVFPKYVHIFDHVTEDGTDCYILSTATSAEGRPAVTVQGEYAADIRPYLFALSTTLQPEGE